MSDYLLNPDFLLIVTALSTVAWLLLFQKTLRHMRLLRLALGAGLAAVLFVIELYGVWSTFGLQSTPAAAYYLAFACDFALALIALNIRNKGSLLFGGAALFCSLILLAVSINDYYQYFPTFRSMFSAEKARGTTTTDLAAHQQPGGSIKSIEDMLYSNGLSHGSIVTNDIPGTVSHLNARPAYIYLPPAYGDAAFKSVKFPVLVLLTGTPGTPSSWLQGGHFTAIMDQFASHHRGITPIVVIADHSGSFTNDTECIDSSHGNADTYLTVDVPAFVRKTYRVASDPAQWGIGGFSEGGMCAAMLTLKHQDVYRHFLDLSGDPFPYLNDTSQTLPVLFHGDKQAQKESNIDWLLAHKPLSPGLTAQFAIGENDNRRLIAEMRQTYHLAEKRKIPTSYESVAHEGHNFTAWSHGYADALPKLSYYLGATQCDTDCAQP